MKKIATARLVKLGPVTRVTRSVGPGTKPELSNPAFSWQA